MQRRLVSIILAVLSCLASGSAAGQEPLPARLYLPLVALPPQVVLLSALHYDGIITDEPDEAFQLYNPGDSRVALGGWQIRSGRAGAAFPAGISLPPHGFLWCGREAVAFRRSFGRLPDCEWAADTDPQVPNLQGAALTFSNTGAAVLLRRPDGTPSDVLLYKAGTLPAEGGWRGLAVSPYKPSVVFHEQGQVLYRKLDARWSLPIPDTDSAADWASDPADVLTGRRVRYAGWDLERFFRPAAADETALLQIFVAPDHAYEALAGWLGTAARSVTFEGYTFESVPIAEVLAQRARTGVAITLLLEGAPVGGVSNQQRWVVQHLAQAGARVYYMRSAPGIHDRYTNQHAKIWLLDDRLALIGSENPSPDAFPNDDKSDGTLGRRGVYIATDASAVVGRIRQIMAADLDLAFADLWPYDASDQDLGAPPVDFAPVHTSGGSQHLTRMPEALSRLGLFRFEVCQAPEHALLPDACLLGLVAKAGRGDVLLIEQLSEPLYWGPADGSPESDPNPRLEAYLAAARRGVKVRLLLDSYFDDLGSSRSNLRTEEYLAAVARTQGLDLEVRRGNPTGLGLHNKMLLAQIGGRGWTMIGSLNGGEASAKLNREVSLVVGSNEAYDYLAGMFWSDWAQ